jgi:uncharacterized membrane protein YbhN (UPF0104 family)
MGESPPPAKWWKSLPAARRTVRLALQVVLTVVALAVVVVKVVGVKNLGESLRRVQPLPLAAAFGLTLPLIGTRIWKWGFVMRAGGLGLPRRQVASSFLAGMWLGLVVPGRIGELGRALYLSKGKRAEGLGFAILDRIFDLAVTILGGSLAYWAIFGGAKGALATVGSLGICALVGFLPPLWPLGEKWLNALPLKRITVPAFRAATSLRGRAVVWCLALGALSLFLGGWQFHLVMVGLQPVRLLASLLAFPASLMAGVISPTISGVGAREGTVALLFQRLYGTPEVKAAGAVAAFVSFLFNSVLPAAVGAFFLGRV